MPATLINGKKAKCVPVSNRGLAYGDGVFTTIKLSGRQPGFWELHRSRLQRDCEKLALDSDFDELEREVASICRSAPDPGVLKVILTRNEGERGYRPPPGQAVRILQLSAFTPYPTGYMTQGVKTVFCRLRLADTPTLAGVKHLNRIEQVLARAEWDQEYQEGLMLDNRGHVVEGTMSNLFIFEGKNLVTPPVDRCGVAGVMREYIMAQAAENGFTAREERLFPDDLYKAQGAFLCNALIGVWPVACIDDPQLHRRHDYADFPAFVKQGISAVMEIVEAAE